MQGAEARSRHGLCAFIGGHTQPPTGGNFDARPCEHGRAEAAPAAMASTSADHKPNVAVPIAVAFLTTGTIQLQRPCAAHGRWPGRCALTLCWVPPLAHIARPTVRSHSHPSEDLKPQPKPHPSHHCSTCRHHGRAGHLREAAFGKCRLERWTEPSSSDREPATATRLKSESTSGGDQIFERDNGVRITECGTASSARTAPNETQSPMISIADRTKFVGPRAANRKAREQAGIKPERRIAATTLLRLHRPLGQDPTPRRRRTKCHPTRSPGHPPTGVGAAQSGSSWWRWPPRQEIWRTPSCGFGRRFPARPSDAPT